MTVPADTAFWLVAGLAILLVGLAKGGFAGLGAVSMPLIALVMDPVQGAAMLLPILMVQDVVSVWSFRKEYDRALLWQMLPGAALGSAVRRVTRVRGPAVRTAERDGTMPPLLDWIGSMVPSARLARSFAANSAHSLGG